MEKTMEKTPEKEKSTRRIGKQGRPSRHFFYSMALAKDKLDPTTLSDLDLLIMLGIDQNTAEKLLEFANNDLWSLEDMDIVDLAAIPGMGEHTVTKIVALFVFSGRFYNRMAQQQMTQSV